MMFLVPVLLPAHTVLNTTSPLLDDGHGVAKLLELKGSRELDTPGNTM